jgi:hypothetical protein
LLKKWIRTLIGIILILSSIAGIIFWELQGRDRLLTERILVAKDEIKIGDLMASDMIKEVSIPKEIIINNPLKINDKQQVIGKISKQYIPINSQLSSGFFQDERFRIENEESIYVIKPEWIEMISSAVRSGDIVEIYSKDRQTIFGEYLVAFVKDSSFREVKSVSENIDENNMLKRNDATSFVSYIEIKTSIEEYGKLVDYINLSLENKLLIVLKASLS